MYTRAVGIYPAGDNPVHGISDLNGNVWEWCLTAGGRDYKSPETEDNCPEGTGRRGARGGSWGFDDSYCRAAARGWFDSSYGGISQGFRVCVSVPI